MKANEVPEKIYMPSELLSEEWTRHIEGEDIEYTCTDAFIEKAQLFLIDKLKEIPMGNGKMKIKADCSLEEFIEEFQKYTKGK